MHSIKTTLYAWYSRRDFVIKLKGAQHCWEIKKKTENKRKIIRREKDVRKSLMIMN